jgi:pimeloyl-ACP methyl ester carboxylesterase
VTGMAARTPRPRQGTVWVQGLEFAYLELGEGPLALCLHGFPDTAWTWGHLLPELASAGFRAVAPWLRGYAPTGVPGDGRYQVGALAADANALHEVLGAPGLDPTAELPPVLEALGAPDNLRAALGYYRALLNRTPHAEGLAAEQAACRAPAVRPTLFLHGSDDGCIGVAVARQADGLFPPGSERSLIGGVGHFPHLEDPKSVGRAIVQFLTNPPACP